MEVHGFKEAGLIRIIVQGEELLVPDDPGNRHRQMVAEWEEQGNVIPPFVAPGPSAGDVDAERDRRIAAGFSFGGVLYQSRPDDRENIMGAATAALGAIASGVPEGNLRWHGGDSDFLWIAADNSTHPMDAQTMFAFGQEALRHKQAHIFSARLLKDADPIPADFATNETYWPD